MWMMTKAVGAFGGYRRTGEYPVERMMCDAKITEVCEDTGEIQRLVMASVLMR